MKEILSISVVLSEVSGAVTVVHVLVSDTFVVLNSLVVEQYHKSGAPKPSVSFVVLKKKTPITLFDTGGREVF